MKRIGSAFGDFGLEDDPSGCFPATSLIGERGKQAHGPVLILGQGLCLIQKGRSQGVKTRIAALAQHIKEVMDFTIVMDFRATEMAVATQNNHHLGPIRPDIGHKPLYDHDDLRAGGASTRTQNGGGQLAAPAFIDMKRHITMFIIMSIKKRKLLVYLRLKLDSGLVGGYKHIDKGLGKPIQLAATHPVLQPTYGRLTGQIIACNGPPVTGHLKRRIRAQAVAIVGIFISAGDLIDPLPHQITKAMIHITLVPMIRYTATKSRNKTYRAVHSPKMQDRTATDQAATVKGSFHFFTGNA